MPASSGPNTLGESNLVFAYDTGDIGNSYKGQPTTNLEASNIDTTFESLADGNTAGFNNQLGTGNYLGVTSTIGYKSSKSLRVNRGTGGTGRIYKTYSVSTGEYSTVSAWVYSTVAGPYLALEYNGGDYSWGVSYTNNTHTGTGWERLFVRTNGSATSNTTAYYFLYTSVQNTDIFLDSIQTEKKQYPTTFVNGTRSATQGLLPLVGTHSLDLSNVSFDSNAKMTFDGTDDVILLTTNFGTLSQYAVEYVAYIGSPGRMPISSRSTTNFYKYGDSSWAYTHGGVSGEYYHSTTPAISGYIHTVISYDGSKVEVWRNGYYAGSQNTTGTANFSDGFRIGYWAAGGGYAWNGDIPVMKIYNKALTAQEVRQNYQQYKTRFNLS